MENETLGGLLRDLAKLALESSDVRVGRLAEDEYREHCWLVYKRIEEAYPEVQGAVVSG
jgi:hypothetical protein